jgi:NAD(P) transhydrogenase subunit alpha
MKIAVPREILPGESRVALVPETVARLRKAGHLVRVESGAGERAGFPDDAYEAAGAEVVDDVAALYAEADVVVKVQRPSFNERLDCSEAELLRRGAALVALLRPFADLALVQLLAERGVESFALELVPRTTRAQYMDVLSSQATVAGYKAVLLAANALPRFFPMLMTAAGTVRPATVLVLGAGVAGLQAIATAKRLGAVVEAFDVRPAVKEQVESLGARFVSLELEGAETQDAGGYAKALDDDHLRRELALIRERAVRADVVITTAQVPNRAAPVLLPEDAVRGMRRGAVIVDLAAESGGNCAMSVAGQTVVRHGVTIMAPLHCTSDLADHASQMYSRNVAAFLELLAAEGAPDVLAPRDDDEIVRGASLTRRGEIVYQPVRERVSRGVPTLPGPRVARGVIK